MSSSPNPNTKVLRIGLFQNNRIIEERLLRTAKTVTIGSDISKRVDNTFVVPASDLPKTLTVFEADKSGQQYTLHFTTEMNGRVKVGDEIKTLQDLIQSGKAQKTPTGFSVPLTLNSQGRLVIGEATLLFQFVTPPPPRAKPVLPASMRGGWIQGMDRILATMLALSAIIHIGAVMFLELQDWPEPLEQEFQIPDKFVTLDAKVKEPDPIEPEVKPEDGEGEGEPEAPSEEPSKPAPKADPEPKEPKEEAKPKSADDLAREEAERQRRLADKVRNKTILSQIGAVSADGSSGSLLDTLSGGAGKTSMEDAFANSKGITSGQAGAEKSTLRSSGSSDADGAGGKSIGIGELGPSSGAKKASEGVGTGDKVAVKIKAKINLKSPEVVIGGTLDGESISKIIKRNEGNFQKCYERELKKNPKAGGKVIVVFEVGTAGRVTKSKAEVDSVGGGTGDCVAQAIERLRFPRPNGGPATVKKTFVFSSGG